MKPVFPTPAEDQATESRDRSAGDYAVDDPGLREMGYAMVDLIVEYLNGL